MYSSRFILIIEEFKNYLREVVKLMAICLEIFSYYSLLRFLFMQSMSDSFIKLQFKPILLCLEPIYSRYYYSLHY